MSVLDGRSQNCAARSKAVTSPSTTAGVGRRPIGADREAFLWVIAPDVRRGRDRSACAEPGSDRPPRGAGAKAVDLAVLHGPHHVGRRYDDELDIAVRVDARCGQPIAQQQIMGRKCVHDREARARPGRRQKTGQTPPDLKRRSFGPQGIGDFRADGNRIAVEAERHRHDQRRSDPAQAEVTAKASGGSITAASS